MAAVEHTMPENKIYRIYFEILSACIPVKKNRVQLATRRRCGQHYGAGFEVGDGI